MKKLLLIVALPLSLCLLSCGGGEANKTETENNTVAAGEYNLSSQKLPIIIKAPSEPLVELTETGLYDVKSSDVFQLVVGDGTADMERVRKDIQSDEVNKLQRMIVDDPNAIFYETKIMEPEFHFYVVLKDGTKVYDFQENKNKKFSEEDVKTMFEAAKAARVAK